MWEPIHRRFRGSGQGLSKHPIADESAPTESAQKKAGDCRLFFYRSDDQRFTQ
jgi:hypothetical protein